MPFKCHEKELIAQFKKEGIIFDKTNSDSDGFIENCGIYYKIHFYKEPEDLQEFLRIHMNVERRIQGIEEK